MTKPDIHVAIDKTEKVIVSCTDLIHIAGAYSMLRNLMKVYKLDYSHTLITGLRFSLATKEDQLFKS